MPKAIQVQHLNYQHKCTQLLKEVSFSVEEGETFAILGPNGSGKSLLIDCILDNISYEKGSEVSILGQTISEHREEVGILYDQFSAFPLLRVREIVDLLFTIFQRKDDPEDAYIRDLKTSLNLEALYDKFFLVLSKGERQRLGIFQALINNPRLLILDEPTSGLDPILRDSFWKLLKRRGQTIVFTTHMWDEVAGAADKVLFISKGELLHPPTHPRTLIEETVPYEMKVVTEKTDLILNSLGSIWPYLEDEDSYYFLLKSDTERERLLTQLMNYTNNYSLFGIDLKDVFLYLKKYAQNPVLI